MSEAKNEREGRRKERNAGQGSGEGNIIMENTKRGAPKGSRHGRYTMPESTPKGEQHWKAKLNEAQVIAILWALIYQEPVRRIASRFRVKPKTIRDIRDGRTWKHVEHPVLER